MSIFNRVRSRASRYERGRVAAAISGAYAVLVLANAAGSVTMGIFADDPTFSGIWLLLVSAPSSFLITSLTFPLIPDEGPSRALGVVLFDLPCTVAGLLQAWLLWRITRGPGKKDTVPHPSPCSAT
ncbi:SCO4225 family membrane protein [Actinomadura sp. NTSP31]|uniref:SCO4225 family membrane protein n=1 Tax=Actinomadura sp. NTSP31 TaxID=1735447 RepID=UPI0035C0527F